MPDGRETESAYGRMRSRLVDIFEDVPGPDTRGDETKAAEITRKREVRYEERLPRGVAFSAAKSADRLVNADEPRAMPLGPFVLGSYEAETNGGHRGPQSTSGPGDRGGGPENPITCS